MVGLVIVSHSDLIAQGIVDLCNQLAQGKVKTIAAGGIDGGLGTDATKIHQAILQADGGDGVVILVDLGSAVMSAELALEMLDEGQAQRVQIADAAVVEGAIAGVVQASIGGNLKEVIASAQEAMQYSKLGK